MTDEETTRARGRLAIGVDVGGSGIKAAVVDVDAGGSCRSDCASRRRRRRRRSAVSASIGRLVGGWPRRPGSPTRAGRRRPAGRRDRRAC